MEKCAIITLATNKEYLRGAELLYITYLRYWNRYPFYVMVLQDQDITGYEHLPIIRVPMLKPKNKNHYGYASYPPIDIFSKFNILEFTDYDYILFLDADYIILNNCDIFIKELIKLLNIYKADILLTNEYTHRFPDGECPVFNSSLMFLKTNHSLFLKIIEYMEFNWDEEMLLYNLNKDNLAKIVLLDDIEKTENGLDWKRVYACHLGGAWIDLYPSLNKKYLKYWDCPEGMEYYGNCLIDNQYPVKKDTPF